MDILELVDLFEALGSPATRAEAACHLARHCGVDEVLLLVRDLEVGALIPANGFPQTVAGGPSWRAFLKQCMQPTMRAQRVEYPLGVEREALCTANGALAAVFLGGVPLPGVIALFARLMPLLSQALAAEQQARFAQAAADAARGAANRARSLADALEAARAEHARLNAQLQEEHQRKDHFLAMLAHELRNPLTPLVTSIELIRRGQGKATEKQLDIMSRQTRQLSRLIEDLLDVSRVSRGRIELRRHRLTLARVVSDAIEASRPFLESRRHRIEASSVEPAVEVFADNVRLAQVFANLLHNAGKYTDPGGVIRVTFGRDTEGAFVSVQDDGLGIAPGLQEGIFELFTQVPTSLARSQGGLGIGLTLAKALVELHGGRLKVHSKGLGHGSTFTVHLPTMSAAPAAVPSQPRPDSTEAGDRPVRVLVIDDNEDAANSTADVLRLMGHHAEVAFSGLKGMHIAEDVDPDLVLLDIGLPDIDGYEVARRLRRSNRRRVRLVAVTGYGAESDRLRAHESGFDEHVVKPVMPETLAGIINRARMTNQEMEGHRLDETLPSPSAGE